MNCDRRARSHNPQQLEVVHPLDGSLIDASGAIVAITIAALWALTAAADLAFTAAGTRQVGFRAVLRAQSAAARSEREEAAWLSTCFSSAGIPTWKQDAPP